MKKIFLPVIALAFGLVGVGCGNENGQPSAGGQPGTVPEITITIPQGATALGTNAFQPSPANVQPGMKVTWVNNDRENHTATSDTGRFDSGVIAPGQSFSWVAPSPMEPGDLAYHCSIHPTMQGILRVTGAPQPSPSMSPTATPSASPTATPSTTPQTMAITIVPGAENLGTSAFQPSPASVQPGMTVSWVNNDSQNHTVTSDVGRFNSGILAPGQSFSWVVPADTGTAQIDYHCEIHPSMRGSLTVG